MHTVAGQQTASELAKGESIYGRITAAVIASLFFLGPLVCFQFVTNERIFYSWDASAYHGLASHLLDAWRTSFGAAFHYLAWSLETDYNAWFAVPLLPILTTFGNQRAIFLSGVYVVWLFPLLLLSGFLLQRVTVTKRRNVFLVGAVIAFATPNYWFTLLRGYPDTCGALLIAAAALAYLDGVATHRPRWRSVVLMGAALGLAVVLRRHYIYALAAFYLSCLAHEAVEVVMPGTAGLRDRARTAIAVLAVASAVSVAVVLLLAPGFVQRALTIVGTHAYASWESSPGDVAYSIVATVGVVPLVAALAGWGLLYWRHPNARSPARLFFFLLLAWLTVWFGSAKQAAYHYPHVLPLFVALGWGALILELGAAKTLVLRRGGTTIAAMALGAFCLNSVAEVGPLALLSRLPALAIPVVYRPPVDPAYQEIGRLVGYLREVAKPESHIIVGASSISLNYDSLHNADLALFGDEGWRLNIEPTPAADSTGETPASQLINADLVVVATPVQYHLRPEDQKTVRVVVDVFAEAWEIAKDFRPLPRTFNLPNGASIVVYARQHPTDMATAAETTRRISEIVWGKTLAGPAWGIVASMFPAAFTPQADGGSRLRAHPPQLGSTVETVFESSPLDSDVVAVNGKLHFADTRCRGARLAFQRTRGTDASVEAFSPNDNDRSFALTLRGQRGDRLRLNVRGADDNVSVDYCTLALEDLRVTEVAQ